MPSESHAFHLAAGNLSENVEGQPLSEADNRWAWLVFGALVMFLTAAYWNMLTFTASF